MGIEMEMGIQSTGMGRNGHCVFREIPAPSDSYQMYSNLQIEFTITVALLSRHSRHKRKRFSVSVAVCLSVALQRGNAVSFHNTFTIE